MRVEPLDFEIHWRRAHPFPWGRQGVINPFVCHFGTSEHTTTQTTNNAPWTAQQPYLTSGFSDASNLLNSPPPTQTNTVAPLTPDQQQAISGIAGQASSGTPITGAATGFDTSLENGAYLNANPANGYFSSLAGNNLGLTGPGSSTLSSFANGGGAGTSTLNNFANGGYFSNGYSDDTAQNIMSQVVPQIASQFNGGNSVNNPQLARSAAAGVTSALAPLEYQNQQTQEQLAQNAASTLGTEQLTGATGANNSAIAGAGVQATGASGLGTNFNSGLTSMVQGNALAPQNQALSYADLQQLFNAGGAQQTQNQNVASASDASANFAQMSPYQQLQAYMSAVTGGIQGGTSATTTPYFTNNTANTLGTVAGGASLLSTALPFLSML